MRTPMDDSLKSIDQHLLQAYQNTSYRIFEPPLTIRIGQPHPALDQWLRSSGHSTWTYLTAYNPGSQLLSDAENEQAQQKLVHW
ncbi:MAG: hypothetical protein KDC44_05865, partial [Phaeodactylibacter sp.]|nr:hypothetical protein [Phaeodactylibacter sp.]